MPQEGINPIEFPDVASELWRWFLDLHSARGQGMAPSPITYLDLFAYAQLHGLAFAAWELDAIRRLDRIALSDDPMKA